jgi:hypothetical protein
MKGRGGRQVLGASKGRRERHRKKKVGTVA